jgi:dephospho-CoA kinase
MIVLGLVGEKGSGKQTFSDYLKKFAKGKKIAHMRFSDILRETLELWSLELSRANYQQVSIAFNKTFGAGTLSRALYNRVLKQEADIVILDGVRWLSDEELINSFPQKFMIYVTAKAENRFERLKTRNEKVGEGDVTFEQFLAEEKVKTETLIPKIGKRADIKIDNNGSFKDLEEKVKSFAANLEQ